MGRAHLTPGRRECYPLPVAWIAIPAFLDPLYQIDQEDGDDTGKETPVMLGPSCKYTMSTIVNRIWNCCHVLRGGGVSYGDYRGAALHSPPIDSGHRGRDASAPR